MPANIDFPKIEKECFHLSEKICPICDQPLREYQHHFCLRCQSRMTLPINETEAADTSTASSYNSHVDRNIILVCNNCERLYTLCPSCLDKTDTCRACQNTRNVCMHCRKNLCAFCLEEISTNKNIENEHVNDRVDNVMKTPLQIVTNDEMEPSDDNKCSQTGNNLNPNVKDHQPTHVREFVSFGSDHNIPTSTTNNNNINNDDIEKPYAKNVNNLHKPEHNTDIFIESEENIERLRRQTDKRLMGYFKNYGELASKSRGTQTTPMTTARRDIVLRGGNNFSIPILCDMPKMTRRETTTTKRDKQISNELENLKYRWDIPAVQKFTISATSPKVVTQVGAIRKQLQTENLLFNDGD
ncbi:uncharacterized protein LOC133321946 [Musca vetustissima]|uniref:uncharacterized protein LOC133321946 n=1 Tax=Musca vetustissima TaxID=27455 RepID=UPI002AB7B7C9|nr:uncharacterized protein LOC133321946 [Musca vetustissima]